MMSELYTPEQQRRIRQERKALRIPLWLMSPTETLGLPCPDCITNADDRADWESKAAMYRAAEAGRKKKVTSRRK
jgi:hypothetical protein